jgi:hypothetical protein
LIIADAAFQPSSQELAVTITQGKTAFEVDVPLRIVPVQGVPLSVEIDPDYDLFRKIPPEFIIPTTASTRYGTAFASVVPDGEVPASYEKIRSIFASSFEDHERIERTAGAVTGGDLAERCALILGDAARAPIVSAFLDAVEFPVRIHENGFEFEGVTYSKSEHSFLCTVRQPGVPGGGVTVVYANSIESIPSPFSIPMYDRSLVVFESGRAVFRKDFERPAVVQVEQAAGG